MVVARRRGRAAVLAVVLNLAVAGGRDGRAGVAVRSGVLDQDNETPARAHQLGVSPGCFDSAGASCCFALRNRVNLASSLRKERTYSQTASPNLSTFAAITTGVHFGLGSTIHRSPYQRVVHVRTCARAVVGRLRWRHLYSRHDHTKALPKQRQRADGAVELDWEAQASQRCYQPPAHVIQVSSFSGVAGDFLFGPCVSLGRKV